MDFRAGPQHHQTPAYWFAKDRPVQWIVLSRQLRFGDIQISWTLRGVPDMIRMSGERTAVRSYEI